MRVHWWYSDAKGVPCAAMPFGGCGKADVIRALEGAAELFWRPKPNQTNFCKLGQVAICRSR